MKSKFKVLSEIEHVHLRPEILLGTIEKIKKHFHIMNTDTNLFEEKEFNFSEGYFRLFEEAITNSIDEYERNQSVTKIKVLIEDDYISIEDDGNGFPLHSYKFNGISKPAPEWILTKLNSGTNFEDDNRKTIGMNGVGISLVNFLSTKFIIKTSNKKNNTYKQIFKNHSKYVSEPSYSGKVEDNYTGTCIKFYPDYSLFNLDNTINKEYELLFKEYIRKLSIVYPKIKFYFNKDRIKINEKNVIKSFLSEEIIEKTIEKDYMLGFGFGNYKNLNEILMINSKPINEYIELNNYTTALFTKTRMILNKKFKLNINRNSWFNENISIIGMFKGETVKFKNQTKDILVSFISGKSQFNFNHIDIDKQAKRFSNNQILIEKYLEYYNKQDSLNSKNLLKKIKNEFVEKLIEATGKNNEEKILILTEGDSAKAALSPVRDKYIHSLLPLKGKVPNCRNLKLSEVLKNTEYSKIIKATQLNNKESLRHGKIYLAQDSDSDGLHIRILLIQFFAKFFPWFIEEGRLSVLIAPLYQYKINKKIKFAYSEEELPKDAKEIIYFKGLGSNTKEANKEMINNPNLLPVTNIKEINKIYDKIYGHK